MNPIVPFQFEQHEIRTVTDEQGTPWFVAKDVASALGYADTVNAVLTHCKKAKSLIDLLGFMEPGYWVLRSAASGSQRGLLLTFDPKTKVIPESDVYRLAMRSKLAAAEEFQDWVVGHFRRVGATVRDLLDALAAFDIPDDLPADLFVYAIRERETGNIKLGISRDPEARVAQLQTGNSCELELVAMFPAANRFADERAVHADAEAYRIRGEWFTARALEVMQ